MSFRRSTRLTAAVAFKESIKREPTTEGIKSHVIEKGTRRKKLSKNLLVSHCPPSSSIHRNAVRTIASEGFETERTSSMNTHHFTAKVKESDADSNKNALFSESSTSKMVSEIDLQKAIAHMISVEPKLKAIIEKNPCHLFSSESLAKDIDPFKELSCSIISQQVSCAAAKSIQRRFVNLFTPPDQDANLFFPSPYQIHSASIEFLRTAGLSQRKAEFLKGLAQKFHTGELDPKMLLNAPDEDIFDALIQVRGLGKWSIEMFACFGLKRIDIFSTGDLGVQKGMAILLGKNIDQLKKKGGKWKYTYEKEMEEVANKFKPFRYVYWRSRRIEVANL